MTSDEPRLPAPGDVLRLTRSASVQFVYPVLVRVIRVLPRTTYEGYLWLDVYELAALYPHDATIRREVWVQITGVEYVTIPRARPAVRQRTAGPAHQTRKGTNERSHGGDRSRRQAGGLRRITGY